MSKRETGPKLALRDILVEASGTLANWHKKCSRGPSPFWVRPTLPTSDYQLEVKCMKTGVSFPSSPSTQPGQRSGQRLPVGNTVLPSPPSTFTLSRLFWLLLRLAVSLLKTWGRCSTSRWFNVQISLRKLLLGIDASASIPQTVMEHLFLAKFCAAGLRKQQFPSAMCPRARPSCFVHK